MTTALYAVRTALALALALALAARTLLLCAAALAISGEYAAAGGWALAARGLAGMACGVAEWLAASAAADPMATIAEVIQ